MKAHANIILVGPMGAGKSTIGRRLAQLLGHEFADSDCEIERRTGVGIPLIFEMEGEAGFRAREAAVLAELARRRGIVLATGGGAVMDPANRELLAASGFVVYLHTSIDEQLRRVGRDSNRPMLQAADRRARLQELLVLRDPLYRSVADLVVDTDGCHVKRVAQIILNRLAQPPDA